LRHTPPLSLGTLNEVHKVLAAGDVVLFTATATESPTSLTEAALMLGIPPRGGRVTWQANHCMKRTGTT